MQTTETMPGALALIAGHRKSGKCYPIHDPTSMTWQSERKPHGACATDCGYCPLDTQTEWEGRAASGSCVAMACPARHAERAERAEGLGRRRTSAVLEHGAKLFLRCAWLSPGKWSAYTWDIVHSCLGMLHQSYNCWSVAVFAQVLYGDLIAVSLLLIHPQPVQEPLFRCELASVNSHCGAAPFCKRVIPQDRGIQLFMPKTRLFPGWELRLSLRRPPFSRVLVQFRNVGDSRG